MKTDQELINRIIARYGDVIDLRKNPGVLIDILRTFNPFADEPGTPPPPPPPPGDGGLPPGGVPPAPSPPGPTSLQGHIRLEDLMKAILGLTRDVAALKKSLVVKAAAPAKTLTRKTKTAAAKPRRR